MKKVVFGTLLLLLLFFVSFVIQRNSVKAQDPSLYLDPKTGEERLVDTTIVKGSQIGFPFENTTNHFSSSFAEILKEKEMVRIGKLEESFTFGIPLNQSFGTLAEAKPTTLANTITYPKVFGGTDLTYTVTPDRLLEELIVPTREEAEKIGEFTQTLALGKLTARKNEDGSITILKDNTAVMFTIPRPILYEETNKSITNDGVVYELATTVGGTKLVKRVTKEGMQWLTDSKRRYPVVIDAAVTVATSTSASAIGNSFQSKVIFNPATSNYWSFYYDGSAIAWASSTDGVTWTVRGSFAYNTFHFSLTQRDSSSTVFLATQCGSDLDICVRKGTIAGTIITWTNEVTALDGTDATTDAYTRPNIVLDRMGNIWVAARKQTAANTFISSVRRSTAIEDPATWQSASTVGTSQTYLLDHIMIPTTYNNMYLVANGGAGDRSIVGYTYNGTSWASAVTGGDAGVPSWSAMSGTKAFGMNDSVQVILVSGTDLYAGGNFTTAGGMTVNYIAKWNGTSWSALGTGMNSTVVALALSGTDLYAGGGFGTAGGVTANRIAKWNGTSWSALGTGMTGSLDYVNALAVSGSDLYAGGDFTTAGGVTVNHIAKWNGTSWSALGTGMNYYVGALAISGSDLYAGGTFTTAGGVTANKVAKWNGTSWSALGTGMNDMVRALALSGTDLYAGGNFTTADGVTVNYIAKWNGTSWSALGTGMNNIVFDLAVSGSDLYAVGWFTTADGVTVNRIAKWNGTSWSALGTGMTIEVTALAVSGSDLYAGGGFGTAGGVTVNRIAKWNGTSWSALGGEMDNGVLALALSGTDLYAGGWFTIAGGVTVNRIAKWNGTSWSALGTGMNDTVRALLVSGSDLYAGGWFTTAGGVTVNRIAKWNGTSWSALGGGMDNYIDGALAVSGTDLYAGGGFGTAGGVTVNRIAKWNGTSWSALGGGMNGTVNALAFIGTDLYAGGVFTTSGGVTTNRIAKWNGTSWSALGGGMDNYIFALAVSGTDLYAGGSFTTSGGVTTNRIAKWNGTSWSALGAGMNNIVRAFLLSGTDLYAVGDFGVIDTSQLGRIGKWSAAGSISASASTAQEIATVSDFSDVTHLLYVDGNADVKYKKFSSSSWGSAVTLLTGTATSPSIAINKANGDLYAFWMEGSTINYKKGVAPYASGNWDASPTTLYSTGTNATITAGSRWDGVFLQWVNGTGSPYGVLFDKLSAGTSTCYPPPGGALYVESNCAVTGTIGGTDDGDMLISAGQTFTVNAGQTIVWGPGKSISINATGASIVLNNTGQLKQTNMWMVDADADGYPASTTTVSAQTDSPGGTYVRRKSLQTYTASDANDGDATVH